MGTVTRSHTFTSGEILTAANLNGEINGLVSAVNGNLDANNVDTSAIPTLTATQTLTNKTLTAPKIGTSILDTNGNELFLLTATGSAVNEFTLANAATSGSPTLSATGGDSNIDITLTPKGTGQVVITTDLKITGDDLYMNTNTSGHILVADGTNYNPVAVSGDVTVASSGAVTIANDAVTNAMMADDAIDTPQIADDAITAALIDDDAVGTAAIADNTTLTTPTLTSPVFNTGVSGSAIKDEDNMASDSATHLATQQSIKKYVDDRILTEDTIAELNDTTITSATSGNVLIYDGSDSWDNKAISNHATLANDGQLTISNDVITNAMMADDAIDTPQIADDAITAALIDDNAVGTAAIASSTTLTTPTLTSPVINVTSDADGDVYYRASGAFARLAKGTAGQVLKMNSGATAPEWGAGSVGGASNLTGLSDVTIASIADKDFLIYDSSSGVFENHHLSGDVTTTNTGVVTIANDAITSAKIVDDAIITALIADDQITNALMADDAIDTAQVADGAITNALVNGSAAIAQSKLNLAITTSEIAGATLITSSETFGNSDTTIPTVAAVKAYSDSVSGVSASSPAFTADMTIFDDQNGASTKLSIGTSSSECANIQVVNNTDFGGNKLVDYLLIETVEASSTADKGKIVFKVDGDEIVEFDDGAVNIYNGKALEIHGTSVLTATTLGSAVVTSSLTTVGALNSGSITSGFTSIDVGSGTIDTTGAVSTGDLSVSGGSTNGVVISQGDIAIKNGGSASTIKFYCESSNAHYLELKAPAHSAYPFGVSNYTLTLPAVTDTLIGRTTTDTLTNKTWNGVVIASAYLDADTAHLTTDQTFTGNKTFTGTVTTGANTAGVDVKLFGTTSGAYLEWDTSADKLLTAGGAVIDIVKDKLLIGGTAVTTTAAELNVLDAVTAGTVTASLGVVVDSNKDIGSFRNVTLTGELDAGSASLKTTANAAGSLQTLLTLEWDPDDNNQMTDDSSGVAVDFKLPDASDNQTIFARQAVICEDDAASGEDGSFSWQIAVGSTLTEKMVLDETGLIVTNDVTSSSDERIKTNIQTIDNALEKVTQLRGASFIKNGKESIGVIAQEVEEIVPEVVVTGKDEEGLKSVAYGNMVGLLIEAVKEQQKEIDRLKEIVNA